MIYLHQQQECNCRMERDNMALTNEDLQAISLLLEPIKQEIKGIENKVEGIENKVESVKNNVTSIQLTLENETNRNIKIIAEGHLD